MRRLAVLCSSLVAAGLASGAGCTVGAPPGFSAGTSWSVPLVGPLEDGPLVVPVFVNDKGPYLFLVDPDANGSAIDQLVVGEAGLHTAAGPRRIDETDTGHPSFYADGVVYRIGTLVVRPSSALIVRPGAFDVAGRAIRGVLGRDVLADSLAFGFDRDRGLAYLTTQRTFRPPAGAIALPYELLSNRFPAEVRPVSRRLVRATVDGQAFALHADLGAVASQLREAAWPRARLSAIPVQTQVVDELGTRRVLPRATVAGKVTAGAATRDGVFFVPYDDRRWDERDLDGTLGLNFFRPFTVWASWDRRTLYLAPRDPAPARLADRVARWGNAEVTRCAHAGCVEVGLIDPLAGKAVAAAVSAEASASGAGAVPAPEAASGAGAVPAPGPASATAGAPVAPPRARPHPGVVFTAARDRSVAAFDLEVLVRATSPTGASLPLLSVSLPAGVARVTEHLGAAFVGAALEVVDVSPFPRACAAGGGCAFQIAAPR